MQHESDELLDLFFKKNHKKEDTDVSKLIRTFFESPTILLQHMKSSLSHPHNRSGLDISKIFQLYNTITHSNKDSELLIIYNNTLNELALEGNYKSFVKSSQQFKYFFIIILWDKLFKIKTYDFVCMRVLDYIQRAPQYRDIFANWLQDIPAQYMRLIIHSLHLVLQVNCKALTDKPQSQQSNRQLGKKCQAVCYFLNLLFKSNKQNQRVSLKTFNSTFLTAFFEPVEQFKIYLNKSQNFNFIKYPFLLDFEYKYKLIQIQSIYEQKMNIRKNMERGLAALIQDFDFSGGNFGVQGLIFLFISVRRNNILDDSMEKLGKVKQNLRSPLKIQFIGQEGTDEGGVKNQYFALLTKEIFNPYLDMFIPKNNGRFYWFNGYSYEMPVRFQFVGMLLGLALYNSVHLNIHFPLITFKKLLIKNYQDEHGLQIIDDLKEIQPDVHRALKNILQATQPLDDLELYFNIRLQSFGQEIVDELVQEGSQIKVNLDNRQEYCLLYSDYLLNKHIHKQFTAFKKGFDRVVCGGITETFESQELSVLINGKEQINIGELEQSTTYEGGYTCQTPIIKHFWQFLYTLNDDEKKNFLTFVTGTDRVPIDGLSALKFNIQRHSNTSNLPTAHTCFNVMLLPQYQNKQVLQKNMKLILEHNQGFGLI